MELQLRGPRTEGLQDNERARARASDRQIGRGRESGILMHWRATGNWASKCVPVSRGMISRGQSHSEADQ